MLERLHSQPQLATNMEKLFISHLCKHEHQELSEKETTN